MTDLRGVLETYVSDGSVPGAVAMVARGDRVEVAVVGSADAEGSAPMARDSIFRIASITKPIAAAAALMRGRAPPASLGPCRTCARKPRSAAPSRSARTGESR